ncbi:uncharacterized protein [Fopius arisanus]|uniref:Uncharacterized protein n=1 Tax=Fopius arisanus TaxID=64838 RepID=A0A9R1T1J7_9HYME|nr:PREDICTED: uncharacterized protein LOC105265536 [Fopius arisanus]
MEKRSRNERGKIDESCCDDVPTCSRDINTRIQQNQLQGHGRRCPAPDVLAQLQFSADPEEIKSILDDVKSGRITQAVEFIFSLRPFVEDGGKILIQVMEKDLADFRKLVDDIVDCRVQDEGDVMHLSQVTMTDKFTHLTKQMKDRTVTILEKLQKISPKFDWKNDGKDESKLSTLISIKEKTTPTSVDPTNNLIHRIFMRNQWLKRELHRLQSDNNNLRMFFKRFKELALQRKAEQIKVPRMLAEQQEMLEKQLEKLKGIYHRNSEKIHGLHLNYDASIDT